MSVLRGKSSFQKMLRWYLYFRVRRTRVGQGYGVSYRPSLENSNIPVHAGDMCVIPRCDAAILPLPLYLLGEGLVG